MYHHIKSCISVEVQDLLPFVFLIKEAKVNKKRTSLCGKSFFVYINKVLYQILVRDTLVLLYTTNSLGKHVCDGNLLNLGATVGVWDGVCEHNFLKG